MAVLERAGLALVAIDRQQPRAGLLTYQPPFAPGRKAGAAEPAQSRMFERPDHLVAGALARKAGLQQAIAALGAVAVETDIGRDRHVGFPGGDGSSDAGERCVLVQRVADCDDRGAVTAAQARRAHDPHPVAEPGRQLPKELRRTGEFAAEAVADPHGQRRRRLLVVHDDVKMGVERGDLVDLDECQPHLLGQRRQMARMETTEAVLQQMQVLDQQVAPAFAVPEQRLHFVQCRGVDLPALWTVEPAPPSRARVNAPVVPSLGVHGLRLPWPPLTLPLRGSLPLPARGERAGVRGLAITPPSLRAARRSRPGRSRANRGFPRCVRQEAATASPRPASRRD